MWKVRNRSFRETVMHKLIASVWWGEEVTAQNEALQGLQSLLKRQMQLERLCCWATCDIIVDTLAERVIQPKDKGYMWSFLTKYFKDLFSWSIYDLLDPCLSSQQASTVRWLELCSHGWADIFSSNSSVAIMGLRSPPRGGQLLMFGNNDRLLEWGHTLCRVKPDWPGSPLWILSLYQWKSIIEASTDRAHIPIFFIHLLRKKRKGAPAALTKMRSACGVLKLSLLVSLKWTSHGV